MTSEETKYFFRYFVYSNNIVYIRCRSVVPGLKKNRMEVVHSTFLDRELQTCSLVDIYIVLYGMFNLHVLILTHTKEVNFN